MQTTIHRTQAKGFIVIAVLLLAACAQHAPVHPGAVNAFDSSAYDALVTIQAAIEQAKVNVPVAQKPLLNKIIADYNVAHQAYVVYHSAAVAGTADPTAQANLQAQIDALKSAVASLK